MICYSRFIVFIICEFSVKCQKNNGIDGFKVKISNGPIEFQFQIQILSFLSNINFYFLNNYLSDLLFQSRKTSHLRGFVFSNYHNLNNGNLLLESGEILKLKWHKTTKNGQRWDYSLSLIHI